VRRFVLERVAARAALLCLAPRRHVFQYVAHHIVFDGWSEGVLLSEVMQLYRCGRTGTPTPVPELPVQYRDFAVWQRCGPGAEVATADLGYWKEQLAGLDPPRLRPDPGAGDAEGRRGRREPLRLEPALVEALRAVARREEATLFVTLLALFQVLLARRTGKDDVVVGAPFSGRSRAEVEPLIGNFVNPLPLRTDLSGCGSFREALGRVRSTVWAAQRHAELPYPRLVAELRAEGRSREAEFHSWFVLQNTPMPSLELPELAVAPVPGERLEVRHDLHLGFWEDGGALAGGVEYRPELYARQTVSDLCAEYLALARAVAEDPGIGLGAVSERLAAETESRRRQRHTSLRRVGLEQLRERRRERSAAATIRAT
jgi:hypothetical protein